MTRAITFIPGTRGGLHYVEQASRNRSVHALFQDTAPGRPQASREQFLRKAYGELVSRFGSTGRIEHPLPFLRALAQSLESLSRRVDCRIDDFTGISIQVLMRDSDAFFLLTSREATVQVDTGNGFGSLDAPGPATLRELPLETRAAQKELFASSARDYLALYRIDPPPAGVAGETPRTVLRAILAGPEGDAAAVVEALADGAAASESSEVSLAAIRHRVVFAEFPPPVPVRDPVLDALRSGESKRPSRLRRTAVGASAALVFAAVAAVWITLQPESSGDVRVQAVAPPQPEETSAEEGSRASQEVSPRHDTAETQELARATPSPAPPVEPAIGMALAWRKRFSKPVTTTPVVDGDAVIFGSRDGHVYALDRRDGADAWTYRARDGVGASPVLAGSAVIAADYQGTVFALDKTSGKALWTAGLPARVVSTPCVAGGEVLVGCTDGKGYGLSLETGRVLWSVETGGRIRASATAAGESFYLPSYDGYLYAITQGSGSVRWKHEIGGRIASTPAADESRVVVGGDGGLYAVEAAGGRLLWHFRTPEPVQSFVAMADGRVFAGGNDGTLYCLDAATGKPAWTAETGGAVLSKPLVQDEVVFVTSYDNYVYCFDTASGERVARFETRGSIFSSPVVYENRVYFGNNEGEFYCINYRSGS